MARKVISCGWLFTGHSAEALQDQTIVVENGKIAFVGPRGQAPPGSPDDEVIDHQKHFVLPGLIDVHVHLSYGNALAQEDIDLYAPLEFRALRALYAAQQVLSAGYTSLMDPGAAALVTASVRDAIEVGLFTGPRITSGGRPLSSRQSLNDYYPTWIGVPATAVAVLITSRDAAIDEIRRQVKDGIDVIKIPMDGTHAARQKGLVAAFTQDETTAMVAEVQRLGRRVAVHARGTEGALYAARAGADIIFHASRIDDEGIEAAVKNKCYICPSLLLPVHTIELTQPSDASYSWWPNIDRQELEHAAARLSKAYEAGVPMLIGSEAGFAVSPYGEWHAKELELCCKWLGMSPADALRATTVTNAQVLRHADKLGGIAVGKTADLLVVKADPLQDITTLQRKENIVDVMLGGESVRLGINERAGRLSSEFAQNMWSEVYTRSRVAAMNVVRHFPEDRPRTGQSGRSR